MQEHARFVKGFTEWLKNHFLGMFELSSRHLAYHARIDTRRGDKVNAEETGQLVPFFAFELDIFETIDDDGEIRINIQAEAYFSMGRFK